MKVIADLDYLWGNVRSGYIEYDVPDDFKDEFLKMDNEEQKEYIFEEGYVRVDDFDVQDIGRITNIQIINDGNTGMA